ncbi:hypothetical protein H0H92_000066 [Tricholoma furcatifolium]|nr:hypothetical protein H0H92_000066 [Tricholoma furcatifolium]
MNVDTTIESTALPSPTSSSVKLTSASTVVSSSASTNSHTSSATQQPDNSNSHLDNVLDIVLGVVLGVVAFIAFLIGAVLWWLGRRRHFANSEGVVHLPSPLEQTPSQSPELRGPETVDMQQYLANTAVPHIAGFSNNTSLASPTSAQFLDTSKPGSVRSDVPSISPSNA